MGDERGHVHGCACKVPHATLIITNSCLLIYRPGTWRNAYDMLLRVREADITTAIMAEIKVQLKSKIQENGIMRARRGRHPRASPLPTPEPKRQKVSNPTESGWKANIWKWLMGKK